MKQIKKLMQRLGGLRTAGLAVMAAVGLADAPAWGGVAEPTTLPASQGYSLMAVENGTAYCVQVFTNTTAAINWTVPANVNSIDYLVVGGGGGGGAACLSTKVGGSGGGGCVTSGKDLGVSAGATLTINVGAGGGAAPIVTPYAAGGNGTQSSLNVGSTTYVALGGGGGGSYPSSSSGNYHNGQSAGTGGGATSWGKSSAGTGTGDGHGGNGGKGNEDVRPYNGGGGGGASTTAGNASGATPGAGVVSAITGESIEYGRGGEGPVEGKLDFKGAVRNGLGEGGRGSNYLGNQVAGAKGSDGVVIVRYAIGSGSVIGSNGYEYEYSKDGKSYHVCVYTNTSGSTTWNKPSGVTSLEYLVVGGGASGGGGVGGGGGAGGFVTGTLSSGLANSYSITVGKGAAGAGLSGRDRYGPVGSDGTSSYFGSVEAKGGGGGGAYGNGTGGGSTTTCPGRLGASGGGASTDVLCSGGSGTDGQGYKGGDSTKIDSGTGGGGGAGSAGQNGGDTKSGYGGNGKSSDITGVMRQYAGGGGGCGGNGVSPGVGQAGGGDGGYYDKGGDGFPATTPGSGGGGGTEYFAGGSGADGVVILRYEVATTYTVTLDQQGGGQGTTSVTATPGQMLPQITRPVRDGYTFGGYFTQTGGAGTQYIKPDGSGAKAWDLTANTTLYAKWTANTHAIAYELDGGTNASGNPTTGTFDAVVTVKAPTKTGYTFAGWKVYAKYEYENRDKLTNRYAKWGKTASPTTDVTYNWESSPSVCVNGADGDVYFKSLTRQSNGNVTLYAQWTLNQYNLTLTKNTGIAELYYKVNGAASFTKVTATTTVKVNYNTTWYAYAVAASGYTYTATSSTNPQTGTMGETGATFAPTATQNMTVSASDYSGTYDGSSHTITLTVSDPSSGATIQYRTNTTDAWSQTKPTRTDVGSTTVYYQIYKSGWTTVTGSQTITITRAKTATEPTKADRTYNGSSQNGYSNAGSYVTLEGTKSATNVGSSYTFTATPDGNHAWSDGTYGARSYTWTMSPATITAVTLASTSTTYDGNAHQPTVSKVTANGKDYSTASTGWDVTYKRGSSTTTDFTSAGTITVTVTGKTNLTGSKSVDFTIGPKSISSLTLTLSPTSYTYDGNAKKPTGTISGLTAGTDFDMSYTSNVNAGTATATATGKGNYTGTATQTFTINKATASCTLSSNSFTYNGSAQGPTVTCSGCTEDLDSVKSATNADTYCVKATPDSNHAWSDGKTTSKSFSWTIGRKALTLTPKHSPITYGDAKPTSGFSYTITTGSLVSGDSLSGTAAYDTTYAQGSAQGTYKITMSGLSNSNYSITFAEGSLTVNKANFSSVSFSVADLTYDGSAQTPTVTKSATAVNSQPMTWTYSLTEGGTYTTTMPKVTTAGDYTLYYTLTAANHNDKKGSATFKVATKAIAATVTGYEKAYDGKAHGITVTVTDPASGATVKYGTASGTYDLTSSPTRTDVGTTTVYYQITAGNYTTKTGSATINVTTTPLTVTADAKSKTFGAADPTLTATVSGTLGSDTVTYTVSRASGEGVGTYTITPSGNATQGNYSVTYITGVFTISAKAMTFTVANIEAVEYTGTAHTPTPTVSDGDKTLTLSTDYTLAYSNNKNAGTATVTVTGKGNYEGSSGSQTFTINKKAITVTADNKTSVYGVATVALTHDGESKLCTGDSFTGALACDATSTSQPGAYDITQGSLAISDGNGVNNYTLTFNKGTYTITPPVYTTNDGKKIAVDPAVMKALFGDDSSEWQTLFMTRNAAGVAGWEAYVLGLTSRTQWDGLTMIITNGDPSAAGLSLSIPKNERELVDTPRIATGSAAGVSAVEYELIGGSSSDAATFQPILDAYVDSGVNRRNNPNFVYLLENMSGNVQFFKIRRRYTFINQN